MCVYIYILQVGGRLERLELLALEMKARGIYCSRALSWGGTEFEVRSTGSTPAAVTLYNQCVALWTALLEWIVGLRAISKGSRPLQPYWAAHQQFFKQLLMSTKVAFWIHGEMW